MATTPEARCCTNRIRAGLHRALVRGLGIGVSGLLTATSVEQELTSTTRTERLGLRSRPERALSAVWHLGDLAAATPGRSAANALLHLGREAELRGYPHHAAHLYLIGLLRLEADDEIWSRWRTPLANRFASIDPGMDATSDHRLCPCAVPAAEIVLAAQRAPDVDVLHADVDHLMAQIDASDAGTVRSWILTLADMPQVQVPFALHMRCIASRAGYIDLSRDTTGPPDSDRTLEERDRRRLVKRVVRVEAKGKDITQAFTDLIDALPSDPHEHGEALVKSLREARLMSAAWFSACLVNQVAELVPHLGGDYEVAQRWLRSCLQPRPLDLEVAGRAQRALGHVLTWSSDLADQTRAVTLLDQSLRECPCNPDTLVWTRIQLWFALHKMADYTGALTQLEMIEADINSHPGEVSAENKAYAEWARLDMDCHLGQPPSIEDAARLREAIVREAPEWQGLMFECDSLIAEIAWAERDVARSRHHLLLAYEGARRMDWDAGVSRAIDLLATLEDDLAERARLQGIAADFAWRAGDDLTAGVLLLKTALAEFRSSQDDAVLPVIMDYWDELEHGRLPWLQVIDLASEVAETIGDAAPEPAISLYESALRGVVEWRCSMTSVGVRQTLLWREAQIRSRLLQLPVSAVEHSRRAELIISREGAARPMPVEGASRHPLSFTHLTAPVHESPTDDFIPVTDPLTVRLRPVPPADACAIALGDLARGVAGERSWVWWAQWTDGQFWHDALVDSSGSVVTQTRPAQPILKALDDYSELLPLAHHGEPDTDARTRLGGLLALDPAQEGAATEALSQHLLPDALRDILSSVTVPDRLIVQPESAAGRVPFPLLMADGARGRRILHRTSVQWLPALLSAPSPTQSPGSGTVLVADLAPRRTHAPVLGRTEVPLPIDHLRAAAVSKRCPPWLARRLRACAPNARLATPAGPHDLHELLAETRPARLIYAGHVDPPLPGTPGSTSLPLGAERLSAAEWYRNPDLLPCPPEFILIGCDSLAAAAPEWLGLTNAALNAGAHRVQASLWPLLNHPDMWDGVNRLVRTFETSAWPEALRHHQRSELDRWRAGRGSHFLHFAALAVVGRFA